MEPFGIMRKRRYRAFKYGKDCYREEAKSLFSRPAKIDLSLMD